LATPRSGPWRILFVIAALFFLVGGPRHPRGTMAEMLAHSDWLPAHLLMLAGWVTLLIALVVFRRASSLPERSQKWLRLALIGVGLQALEMGIHAIANLDHGNLMAGRPTPLLTTHLWLAAVCYPIFGITATGLILATVRDRVLGSPWIAWIGILGALAEGLAAPVVLLTEIPWTRILFPLFMLFAIWLILAALWPLRASRTSPR
jgi:hypothetical protein